MDCKSPMLKLSPTITKILDPARVQSQILPKVLLVHDIHSFYNCCSQDLRTLEMSKFFDKLCVDGILKPKHNHLEIKGLTHTLYILKEFQVKWIRFILNRINNRKL